MRASRSLLEDSDGGLFRTAQSDTQSGPSVEETRLLSAISGLHDLPPICHRRRQDADLLPPPKPPANTNGDSTVSASNFRRTIANPFSPPSAAVSSPTTTIPTTAKDRIQFPRARSPLPLHLLPRPLFLLPEVRNEQIYGNLRINATG